MVAPVAAAAGVATYVIHSLRADCAAGGDPWGRTAATVFDPRWLPVAVAALVVALVARRWLRRAMLRAGASGGDAERALALGLFSLVLPTLGPGLDTVAFGCTIGPLAFLGAGLGALALAAWAEAPKESSPGATDLAGRASRRRLALAVLAAALPLALLPWWPAPAGDEAQYLVVAHSLVTDGDLDVADEFTHSEYRDFYPGFLWPHTKPGTRPDSRYSMHGAGLPILLAPAYAVGRRVGGAALHIVPRALVALLFAAFACVLFGMLRDLCGETAATYGTAATCLLAPLPFAAVSLFPEVPAMLLSCSAFLLLRRGRPGDRWLAALLVAALPWVGVKYLALALGLVVAAAVLGGEGRVGRQPGGAGGRTADVPTTAPRRPAGALRASMPLAVALGLSMLGHTAFTWALYGSLSPAAVYVGGAAAASARPPAFGAAWWEYLARWPGAVRMALGYLVDQKEGLLAVGPHFLLAALGCGWLWRRRRRELVALVVVLASHAGLYAASQVPGGHGPPARPLMAVLWTLAPALGVGLAACAGGRTVAALRGALVALAAALTAAYAARPELLPHDFGVPASWLLRDLFPAGTETWRAFPLLINVPSPPWAVAAAWLVAGAALCTWLFRHGRRAASTGGRWAHRRWGRAAALCAVVALSGLGLWSRAEVVVSDRHEGMTVEPGYRVLVAQAIPERAWVEPRGVWAAPGGWRQFVLLSERPLERVDVALSALVATPVVADLQGAAASGMIGPDAVLRVGLQPAPGWPWRGYRAYRLTLWAAEGASPSRLGPSRDHRLLGVYLRLVETR